MLDVSSMVLCKEVGENLHVLEWVPYSLIVEIYGVTIATYQKCNVHIYIHIHSKHPSTRLSVKEVMRGMVRECPRVSCIFGCFVKVPVITGKTF